jgi:O-antigen/teichoic acid export membrane protein
MIFKSSDSKNNTIKKNIFFSIPIKLVSILTSLLSVNILLNILGESDYGLWITLTSFMGWFGVFDLGIGNGLRNKVTQEIENKNYEAVQRYISSAYIGLGCIALTVASIFVSIGFWINWNAVFNTQNSNGRLYLMVSILFSSTMVMFVVRLVQTILSALQRTALSDAIVVGTQVVLLLIVYLLQTLMVDKLLLLSIIYALAPLLPLVLATLYFSKKYEYIRPRFSLYDSTYFKEIASLGGRFFILQLTVVVVYTSDNFLIAQLFSTKDVAVYSVCFKYFSMVTMVWSIVLAPYWSMTAKAMANNDLAWIRQSVKNLVKIWAFLVLGILIMVVLAPTVFHYWVGNKIAEIPQSVIWVCAGYVVVYTWCNPFAQILNGMSRMEVQLYNAVFCMLLNIPLVLLLCKYCECGIVGVPLAGVLCMLVGAILAPLQVYKVINNLSKNTIWDR